MSANLSRLHRNPRVSIRPADWAHLGESLLAVRKQVFCVEQGVDLAIEIDGRDEHCVHLAAVDDDTGHIVGTARMDLIAPHDGQPGPIGHIGRVAVLAAYRGQGIGRRLMLHMIDDACRRRLPRADLNAQTHAAPFYASLGFTAHGPEFLEANIPHVNMVLELDTVPRKSHER